MTCNTTHDGHFIHNSFNIGPNILLETGTFFLLTSTQHFRQT